MIRVYARRIIAGMKNMYRCPVSRGNQKGKSVCETKADTLQGNCNRKMAVAFFDSFPGPFPAVAPRAKARGLINLPPESLNVLVGQCRRVYIYVSHLNHLSGLVRPGRMLDAFVRAESILTQC